MSWSSLILALAASSACSSSLMRCCALCTSLRAASSSPCDSLRLVCMLAVSLSSNCRMSFSWLTSWVPRMLSLWLCRRCWKSPVLLLISDSLSRKVSSSARSELVASSSECFSVPCLWITSLRLASS
ncbi:hypothetical protein D3C85_1340690 [compost metagenome]